MVTDELKDEIKQVIRDRDLLACSVPAETAQLGMLMLVAELRLLRRDLGSLKDDVLSYVVDVENAVDNVRGAIGNS